MYPLASIQALAILIDAGATILVVEKRLDDLTDDSILLVQEDVI
jgi:hypothetical protein